MSIKNTRLLAIILSSALVASSLVSGAAGQSLSENDGPGRTWALVVGVSRYQKLPGGQQLQFAERDAADFAQAISSTTGAERLRVLLGQQATSSNIKSSIGNWLARSAWEADTVVLFFSGHALIERDFGEAYLLASDSDPKNPYTTGVSLNELSHALSRRVRARRVLVIADAIRRDLFPPDSEAARSNSIFESLDRLAASRPGLTAILASGPGEFSREGQRWGGRGVFTKHLLDGLSGTADSDKNGIVTASEAFEYTSAKVSEDTSNKQRPWRTETAIAQVVLTRR
ncbi:MAG TPA: caspase family protein, partial [Blastocatellia bacterium]|nr:caspase family protein [Blastocatellia bacterium]